MSELKDWYTELVMTFLDCTSIFGNKLDVIYFVLDEMGKLSQFFALIKLLSSLRES